VEEFPTLIVIKTDGEKVAYNGKIQHAPLFKFLSTYAAEKPPNKYSKKDKSSSSSESKEKTESAPPPPPAFVWPALDEVKTQKDFNAICENGNCAVVFLDPTNTGDEHKQHLELLETLNEKHKNFFHFLWVDASVQTDFVQAFNLNSGFPSIVIYNLKKKTVVPFLGSFTQDSIEDYLGRVMRGKLGRNVFILKDTPSINEGQKKEEHKKVEL